MTEAGRIVIRPEALSDNFVPPRLHARDEQLGQLWSCLAPALKGRKPLHALLVGPSGSGKTLVSRAALRDLAKRNVRCVYINCWGTDSLYSVLDKIVAELKIVGAAKIDVGFKLQAIEEYLKKRPLVLVLDEIEKLSTKERNAVLYHLTGVGNTGVVCVSRDRHSFHSLEDQVQARLYPSTIIFKPYEAAEIEVILRHRAEQALAENAVSDEDITFIASQCGGNARIALEILRKAAAFAEQRAAKQLTNEHVKLASVAVNGSKKDYLLSGNKHLRLAYEIIKANPGIASGELWKAYVERCRAEGKEPAANRTFLLHLDRLRRLSLIAAERADAKGNVRKYRAVG